MTLQLQEQLQQAWDQHCREKGYAPRLGIETRYDSDGNCYHLASGYGRVLFNVQLGWIVVLSYWGMDMDDVYQYVSCANTKWADIPYAPNSGGVV